jgi:hypothetical protein
LDQTSAKIQNEKIIARRDRNLLINEYETSVALLVCRQKSFSAESAELSIFNSRSEHVKHLGDNRFRTGIKSQVEEKHSPTHRHPKA